MRPSIDRCQDGAIHSHMGSDEELVFTPNDRRPLETWPGEPAMAFTFNNDGYARKYMGLGTTVGSLIEAQRRSNNWVTVKMDRHSWFGTVMELVRQNGDRGIQGDTWQTGG